MTLYFVTIVVELFLVELHSISMSITSSPSAVKSVLTTIYGMGKMRLVIVIG